MLRLFLVIPFLLLCANAQILNTKCPYTTIECADCDVSKLYLDYDTATASSMKCPLGYTMLAQYGASPVEVTTALCINSVWSVANPILSISATANQFTCKKNPVVAVEECGCPYVADTTLVANNPSKLFVQSSSGTGRGNCTLQCDTGYRLTTRYGTQPASYASCLNGYWFYVDANKDEFRTVEAKFSCEKAPATCAQTYNTAPCPAAAAGYCYPGAIRSIQGTRSDCMLSCAKGYRLWEGNTNSYMAELSYEGGQWKGRKMDGDFSRTDISAGVSVTCVRYMPPAEIARTPPDTVKPACGCWYQLSACVNCDYKQLFLLDGFGAYSAKCTLGCAKGYVLEGGETTIISCKGGYWSAASSITLTSSYMPAPFGYMTTSCVPQTTTPIPCDTSKYTTFECAGCDKTKLISLPATKGNCVLSCDKGFRLVTLDEAGKSVRCNEAVLLEDWKVTTLNDIAPTITLQPSRAQFTCEPATLIA